MKFSLGQDTSDADDVVQMINSLLTRKFTMGEQVEAFEKKFAEYVGAKHALMVNSGSSANLIAISALSNYQRRTGLGPGDEVLVPALCWSTSLFPLIQNNLTPVFVDINPKSLNMDLEDLERKITNKSKAIMLVHVLGNCTEMDRLMALVEKYHLLLIEDTCESLGSTYNDRHLGTFGTIGTYSFYYSHHITTGEGGMVVCNDDDDYQIMKCLRAHGWTRGLSCQREVAEKHPDLDPRFTFINLGYNFRPMEIQAAMGLSQLGKITSKNQNRLSNYYKIKGKILSDPRHRGLISFPLETSNAAPVWFGIVLFLRDDIPLHPYLNYLTESGVENRPIITGNMVRQPIIQDLCPHLNAEDFPGADQCHFHGLFIGLPTFVMADEAIDELSDILLSFPH